MGVSLIAPPVVEPVALAEMKARLDIDHDLADPLLDTLVTTARAAVERLTRRSLTTQTWRLSLDAVPEGGVVALPFAPVQAVTAVRVADAAGTLAAWPGERILVDLVGEPARVVFRGPRPVPGVPVGGVEIDAVTGYGADPAAVPAPLRQAVALLAGHWYVHRGTVPTPLMTPEIAALLDGWRRPRLAA